ncbi:MAG TPA: SDR family oxidoreductase [Stellaceae bacterium]|nr:SDR family oxidoreductase [Stellaceae bacterium]
MPTVLITGASRGIGLEFARQYTREGWRVIATCRDPARAEKLRAAAAGAELRRLDVTDHAGVAALARELEDRAIDVFISNAGVYLDKGLPLGRLDDAAWEESFAVNSVGPMVCAAAFLPHVARSGERKMVALGSAAASITQIRYGGGYAYRASKAALHECWRTLAFDHPEIIATVLSPARVRTDMNPEAPLAPEESVAGLCRVIARLTRAESGAFLRYDGSALPW